MSMYITFTWQRPAISSRADGCVKEGPPCGSADARDLGIGKDYDKRRPGCGSRFWRVQGTAPPGCLCRLDKAHTRVPLWRACGRRLLAGSRRTSVKARTAGGGPHPSASAQRHGGACSPPACAGAGGSAQLPRREPMSVPAHPAAASARVSLQGLRLRERTASRLPSDGAAVIPPAPADDEPKAGVSQAAGALTASW
jgi:hypothetical protein